MLTQDIAVPDTAPTNRIFRGEMPRRLYRIPEAADLVGCKLAGIFTRIDDGELPVLRLPSLAGNKTRLPRRVPAAWLDHWLDMMDRSNPIRTDAALVLAAAAGPHYLTVRKAAEALSVSHDWLYKAILSGEFPEPTVVGKHYRIRRAVLDAWVLDLITRGEAEWYGQRAVARLVEPLETAR